MGLDLNKTDTWNESEMWNSFSWVHVFGLVHFHFIILSHSTCSNPAWAYSFCWTQKNKLRKMLEKHVHRLPGEVMTLRCAASGGSLRSPESFLLKRHKVDACRKVLKSQNIAYTTRRVLAPHIHLFEWYLNEVCLLFVHISNISGHR